MITESALMSHTPLSRVIDIVTTCHYLERRVKLDAEVFSRRTATPSERQKVATRLLRFEETIQIVAGIKQRPEYGTYTFRNILDAIIASLREMKIILERSIAVPPLKGLPKFK